MRPLRRWAIAAGALLLATVARAAPPRPIDWAPLDAAVRAQIAARQLPGAVIVIGDADGLWLRRAWGLRARVPEPEPMTPDTVFDLASLTKVIATTTAVMQLAERHQLALDAPAARYWPAFGAHGKGRITVAQLLSHSSGLRPDLDLREPWHGRSAALRRVIAEAPVAEPGSRVIYSDINFLVLGELVQRVSGLPLPLYAERHIFRPLGMRDTGFLPGRTLIPRVAPTVFSEGRMLRGVVHDPTARRMGGVAGHAGLFGTADDLARFAQALLRGHRPPLDAAAVGQLRQPLSPAAQEPWHGAGWQLQPPLAAARDELPPLGAIGHTGYTGTGLWIDFVQRRFVIVLSNRVHPDGGGDARPLRRQVLALVSALAPPVAAQRLAAFDPRFAGHLQPPPPDSARPAVLTGIDVLRQQGYAALQGRRVGLITNLSAIDGQGWRTVDRLRWAPGVTLVKVFSPEHGLYGDLEGAVPSGIEPLSGVPLVSLYGATRRPTPEMLQDIDTLVFDLQDAGARFFTYLSTMGEAMEAAAAQGLRFVVLDRPDPVGADRIAGPVLDAGRESFTAYTRLPVQHGMTIAELALLLRDELRERRMLELDLQVVAMQGYRRNLRFEQTRLDWVPPSPNLRTVTTALLYPGTAWIEGANVSVGRGTEHPFEWMGAPWIDAERLAQALAQMQLPGVGFAPLHFTPQASAYQGQLCHGVQIRITDRERFDAPLLGAALVQALSTLWPETFKAEATLGMVGSAATLQALRAGLPPAEAMRQWQPELEAFRARRERYLLYAGPPEAAVR